MPAVEAQADQQLPALTTDPTPATIPQPMPAGEVLADPVPRTTPDLAPTPVEVPATEQDLAHAEYLAAARVPSHVGSDPSTLRPSSVATDDAHQPALDKPTTTTALEPSMPAGDAAAAGDAAVQDASISSSLAVASATDNGSQAASSADDGAPAIEEASPSENITAAVDHTKGARVSDFANA
ncbi:hypothetical protein CYMTET_28950 [Cymbomonas tetramitiformis]|uniref:Uncharacterized protein n=1 Tax=Cymbomonas tetramitiformis TaxID=36881 RepID=A0AAE0KVP7_9CHLO|nr:hypothetical protein CYMTET_28950 [Cymbomonas tetramitiformis]